MAVSNVKKTDKYNYSQVYGGDQGYKSYLIKWLEDLENNTTITPEEKKNKKQQFVDWINKLQINAYNVLGNDWDGKEITGDHVKKMQQDFKDFGEWLGYGDFGNEVIGRNEDMVSQGKTNANIDNPEAGYKVDGRVGGRTSLRYMLGKLGDGVDWLKEIDDFNKYGIGFKIDRNLAGEYNLATLHDGPLDDGASLLTDANRLLPKKPQLDLPLFNFPGDLPNQKKKLDPNLLYKGASALLGAARLPAALAANRRIYNAVLPSLKAPLQNTYYTHHPIFGDWATMQAKNQQGADILSKLSKPLTSDARMQYNALLTGMDKYNQAQTEGKLAFNKRVDETREKSIATAWDNDKRYSETANINTQLLNKARRERAQLKASKHKLDWQSWDQFLAEKQAELQSKWDNRETEVKNFRKTLFESYLKNKLEGATKPWLAAYNTWSQSEEGKKAYGSILAWPQYNAYIEAMDKENDRAQDLQLEFGANELNLDLNELRRSLPRFQQGGQFDSLFALYRPIAQPKQAPRQAQPAQSAAPKKEKGDELSEKDLLEMVKSVDGLPNEMQSIIAGLTNTLQVAKAFGKKDSINTLATTYLSYLYKIKETAFNKTEFKNAYDLAKENEALNDLAINDAGQLAVFNSKKELTFVKRSEFLNNSKEYQPLTNGQLLWLRYRDPRYVNRNDIFFITNNGIGMNKIAKMIQDRVAQLGTNKESSESYITKAGWQGLTEQQKEGMGILYQLIGAGSDGVYKIKKATSTQTDQINAALSYIYSTLPNNVKNRLAYATSEKDAGQGVLKILQNLLLSRASTEVTYSVGLDMNASKIAGLVPDTSSSSSKSQKDDSKLGEWGRLMTGQGGIDSRITIMEGETKYGIGVNGKYYSALPKTKGPVSLQQLLTSTGLQDAIQGIQGITFGNARVGTQDLGHIVYDNSGGYVATLPATTKDGVKVVNLEFMQVYSDIVQKLAQRGIRDGEAGFTEALGQALKDRGYSQLLTEEGLPSTKYFGQFLIIQGYSTEKVGSIDSKYSENKKNGFNPIKKVNADGQLQQLITGTLKYDTLNKGWTRAWLDDYDIYKAAVYIPLSNNLNDAASADDLKISETKAMSNERFYQNFNKRQTLASTSSTILQQK